MPIVIPTPLVGLERAHTSTLITAGYALADDQCSRRRGFGVGNKRAGVDKHKCRPRRTGRRQCVCGRRIRCLDDRFAVETGDNEHTRGRSSECAAICAIGGDLDPGRFANLTPLDRREVQRLPNRTVRNLDTELERVAIAIFQRSDRCVHNLTHPLVQQLAVRSDDRVVEPFDDLVDRPVGVDRRGHVGNRLVHLNAHLRGRRACAAMSESERDDGE